MGACSSGHLTFFVPHNDLLKIYGFQTHAMVEYYSHVHNFTSYVHSIKSHTHMFQGRAHKIKEKFEITKRVIGRRKSKY